MSTSVYDLAVNISTNIASLNEGMAKASDVVNRTASQISKQFEQVSTSVHQVGKALSVVAAIATVGLGIKGLSDLVTGAISAQAELHKLAQATGATVESLSAMRISAALTGTGMDAVATGMQKFAKAIATAESGTGSAAKALQSLGFDAKNFASQFESTDAALLAVSRRLNEYEDGIAKTAVAQLLLGKAGAQLLPFLAELGERGTDAVRVTAAQAAVAHDLEKAWIELTRSGKVMWNTIATQIVPALDGLVRGFLAVINQTGGVRKVVNDLAADGSIASWAQRSAISVAGFTDSFVNFITVLKSIVFVAANVVTSFLEIGRAATGASAILQGNFAAGWELLKTATERVGVAIADVKNQFAILGGPVSTKFKDAVTSSITGVALLGEVAKKSTLAVAGLGEKTAGAFVDMTRAMQAYLKALADLARAESEGQAKVALAANANAQAALKRQYDQGVIDFKDYWDRKTLLQGDAIAISETQLQDAVDIAAKLVKQREALLNDLKTGPKGDDYNKKLLEAETNLIEATTGLTKAQGALNVEREKATELGKDYIAQLIAESNGLLQGGRALENEIEKRQRANEEIGLTTAQIYELQIARVQEKVANTNLLEQTPALLQMYDDQIERLRRLGAATVEGENKQRFVQGWADLFKSAAASGSTFIENFVTKGSSAFKTLWGDFKSWALKAFAEIAAKQIIVSIAGSLGLGGAGNALAGSGGPLGAILGGGSPGGGLGSFLSDLFGGGGPAGGGGFGQNDRGLGVSNSFGGIGDIFSKFTGGLSTIGGGFSSFFDLVGSGTSIFSAAGSAFAGMGGALTAVLGPIGLIGGAIALLSGLFKKGGGPKEGGTAGFTEFYPGETSAANNAKLQATVDALTVNFQAEMKLLGGKGAAAFALGFDIDPKGTAGSRVSVGATVGGQSVYSQRDIDVGRDDAALQARLGLEAQRALLAALQASELPNYLAEIFKGVDAASATSDQINKIIATAGALKYAVDVVSGLGEKFANLNPEDIQALITAFGGLDTFTKTFAFIGANFQTTTNKIQKESDGLAAAFASLDIAVPKTHQAFLDLLSGMDVTTDEGRKLYASIAALAPAFVDVYGTADQAAQALEKLAQSAADFFNANFYSAGEQQAAKVAADFQKIAAAQTALGVAIPATVEGFRALIEGIDQSTEAGKTLYAALIVLAPAVFEVATAASGAAVKIVDAANSINSISFGVSVPAAADALIAFEANIKTLADSLTGDTGDKLSFRIAQLQAKKREMDAQILAAQDAGRYGEAYVIQQAERPLFGDINALVAQLARFTVLSAQYGAAIADQLVPLEQWYADQKALFAGNASALTALQSIFQDKFIAIINGTSGAVEGAVEALDSFIKKIQQLAGAAGGNAGQEARLELAQSKPKLDQLQTQYANLKPDSALGPALLGQINAIKAYNDGLAKQIANFTIYTAQYGVQGANQLIALERQYSEQQQAFAGNSEALGVLDEIFNDRWKAIIDGLSGGVDGSLEQLERLRKGIADYLQGLQVGSLSPLTPLQKLQQAQTDFEAEVAKAQGGDQGALGDVTKFADVFLNLARDAYASGQQYTDIFNTVTTQLRGLASPITSDPSDGTFFGTGGNDAINSLSVALPANGGRLMSADDAKVLGDRLIDAIFAGATAHADANTADSLLVTQALTQTTVAIVDAVYSGLK